MFIDGNFSPENNTGASKKEKIIVAALAVIFIAVLLGAFWDLYGKKLFCSCDCGSKNTAATVNSLQSTSTLGAAALPAGGQGAATSSQGGRTGTSDGAARPKPADSNIAYSAYSMCLENTKDVRESKDCCDCLSGDDALHKACRDAAAQYDFSKNTVFKTFDIPSTLGRSGDYSVCTALGSQDQCKQCCESGDRFVCGDYQYCRTACNSLPQ